MKAKIDTLLKCDDTLLFNTHKLISAGSRSLSCPSAVRSMNKVTVRKTILNPLHAFLQRSQEDKSNSQHFG